jgi:hypothetical protein
MKVPRLRVKDPEPRRFGRDDDCTAGWCRAHNKELHPRAGVGRIGAL